MPSFEHACFISYKHPPDVEYSAARQHFWMEFIDTFQVNLQAYVTIGLSVYKDDILKTKPGVRYPGELAYRLCKSVCMVAVLVPEYFESDWCRAEWKAMEKLEAKRSVNEKRDGLIVPVLLRGDMEKAAGLAQDRDILDFRRVINPKRHLDTNRSRQILESIANRIKGYSRTLQCTACDDFRIDLGPEQNAPALDDPDPLEF